MRLTKVWDLPVRLFHWILVVLIASSWLTQEFGKMDVHMWIGEWILTLLIFRLVWGLIGSDTARFSHFLRSPFEALRHLMHMTRREPDTEVGHNAAGGWMVLAMLGLIAVQTGSGCLRGGIGNLRTCCRMRSRDRSLVPVATLPSRTSFETQSRYRRH